VQIGPSTGRVAVRRALLADSRNARVRVRIDDGFNEATTTSGRLTVVGPAPAVRILSPLRGQRARADASLRLAAEGTGAGGRPLSRKTFRWFDGTRKLGRGSTVTVAGLRPGRHVIRLAASQGGRTGSARVSVTVTAVRPAFLRLDYPQRISSTARAVRLRVAATVAADLVVLGHRYPVGPKARTLKVGVRPGRSALKLALILRSGRLQTRQTLAIARGGA
jgi:hypothetical protein